MRRFISLSLLLAAGMVYAQDGTTAGAEAKKEKYVPKDRISSAEYKLSYQRIDAICAIIQNHYDKRDKLDSEEVIAQIKEEIGKIVPVTPAKPADNRTRDQIREAQQAAVDKKYPASTEAIRKEAEAEAVKKFPMAKRGDVVTVQYRRGGSYRTVKGHYYGFGIGGKSIRINSTNVPYFDLVPECKSMFEKTANEQARKDFVAEKINQYYILRNTYSSKLFNAEATAVRQANEKLGYIFRRNKWITAEVVMEEQRQVMLEKAKARDEAERLEKERLAKENPNANNGEQGNADNNENADNSETAND